jgi:hypothetical protein
VPALTVLTRILCLVEIPLDQGLAVTVIHVMVLVVEEFDVTV